MEYVDLVAILAVLQLLFFVFLTGGARAKAGIKAPAVTGDPNFERMYRVQSNTIETIVVFLPSLLLAAKYWSPLLVATLGLIYIVGRFIYWRAYVKNPENRTLGFMLSIMPTAVLCAFALMGALLAIIK